MNHANPVAWTGSSSRGDFRDQSADQMKRSYPVYLDPSDAGSD